jgi:hypothetical protein
MGGRNGRSQVLSPRSNRRGKDRTDRKQRKPPPKEELGSFVPNLYKESEEGSAFQGRAAPIQISSEGNGGDNGSIIKKKVIMEINPLTGEDRPVGLPKITRNYVREGW